MIIDELENKKHPLLKITLKYFYCTYLLFINYLLTMVLKTGSKLAQRNTMGALKY